MKSSETLASMSIDDLKKFRREILKEKVKNAERLAEASTPIGLRILERHRKELADVLKEYGEIIVRGRDAQAVVLELSGTQHRERFLNNEIANMEDAKNIAEGLDSQLAVCDDVLRSKENRAHLER